MLPHNYSKNKCKQDVFFGNCKITNYLSKILYKSSKNKLFWVQKPVMSCSYKGDRNNRLDGVRSNPVLDRVILGITYPVKIRSETQKRAKKKTEKLKTFLEKKNKKKKKNKRRK